MNIRRAEAESFKNPGLKKTDLPTIFEEIVVEELIDLDNVCGSYFGVFRMTD